MKSEWYHTGKRCKFFFWDWLVFLPLFLLIFFPTSLKLYLTLLVMLICSFFLNRYGYNVPNFIRWIHYRFVVNKKALGKPSWQKRKWL